MTAALALGACGGDDSSNSEAGKSLGGNAGAGVSGPRYPYPAETVRAFVDSCAKNGARKVCQCTIERLQQTLPFDDFSAADRAIRTGRDLVPKTRQTINDATDACRE